jgi:hypothetical protein
LKLVVNQRMFEVCTWHTYSVRSMISKPFEHRTAIRALRKMRSYASDGRKNS